MPLVLVTAPASDPVTLAEVKGHLRVDASDDDARIGEFIKAATQRLDGRDGALGVCLITQTWRLTLDRFASEIAIPLPPCQSITSITYVDPDGTTRTLDSTDYQVSGLGSMDGARVRAGYGKSWPAIRDIPEAVAITFAAGFSSTASSIPEPIRANIRMRVAHLYENRESVMVGARSAIELPDGPDDFARNFKTWSF